MIMKRATMVVSQGFFAPPDLLIVLACSAHTYVNKKNIYLFFV